MRFPRSSGELRFARFLSRQRAPFISGSCTIGAQYSGMNVPSSISKRKSALNPNWYWAGATIAVAVALVLAASVIPVVRADHVFHATPRQASLVLWLVVGANLLLAGGFGWLAVRRAGSPRVLGWWAVCSMILAFELMDPALGYYEHDNAALRRAATLLFLCAAAELTAAALAAFAWSRTRQVPSIPS